MTASVSALRWACCCWVISRSWLIASWRKAGTGGSAKQVLDHALMYGSPRAMGIAARFRGVKHLESNLAFEIEPGNVLHLFVSLCHVTPPLLDCREMPSQVRRSSGSQQTARLMFPPACLH